MEFMNRSGQQAAPARAAQSASAPAGGGGRTKGFKGGPMWLRVVWIVLLVGVTALVVCLVTLLYFGGPKEANFIDNSKQQAVFLTNGQVYFGKVKAVNKQYLSLTDIYYLNVSQQVQPNQQTKDQQAAQNNSVSLVKLGCELHGPVDQMVINREQVTFWENLKTDGQVATAIAKWREQNPDGQKCDAANANTNTTTDTTTKP